MLYRVEDNASKSNFLTIKNERGANRFPLYPRSPISTPLGSLAHTGTNGKRHNKSERKQCGVYSGAHFMVHRVEAQRANTDEEEDNA